MFDKLIKVLKELDGKEISIPINSDENGYFDKECPECMFQFKIKSEDWENKVNDNHFFCPMCRNESTSDSFYPSKQIQDAKKKSFDYIENEIHRAMKTDANLFNRKQSNNKFITMSMQVKGLNTKKVILPIKSAEIFEQKIECERCKSNFAVIGSAFFCPVCGHNSIERTFSNTMNRIKSSINNLSTIRKALDELNKDESQDTCQTIIEKGLLDCVVAFQRYCEVMYKKHKDSKTKIPMNVFQRLDDGGKLWKDVLGKSYKDWLSENQYNQLNIFFQRRHLLQHKEGIVDKVYLNKSNDTKYKIEQRIIINERDVLDFVDFVISITDELRKRLNYTKST